VWIFVFVILNLGLAVTAYLSITNGDLNRLINGYDFRTVLCGVGNYADKPYLYFIDPVADINIGICVQNCPSTTGDTICLYKKDGITPTSFCYVQMQTTYNGRYCYPVEPINHAIVDTFLNSFYNSVRRTVTDFLIVNFFLYSFYTNNVLGQRNNSIWNCTCHCYFLIVFNTP